MQISGCLSQERNPYVSATHQHTIYISFFLHQAASTDGLSAGSRRRRARSTGALGALPARPAAAGRSGARGAPPPRPCRPLPPLRRRFLLENRHRVFVSAVTRSSPRRAHKVGPGCSSPPGTKTLISCLCFFSREASRKRKSSRFREGHFRKQGNWLVGWKYAIWEKAKSADFLHHPFTEDIILRRRGGNAASQTKGVIDF